VVFSKTKVHCFPDICDFLAQGFVTNNNSALELLYGDAEYSRKGVACLNQMADCVATVFASLRVL
jgi:hypothetical protein